MKQKKKKIKLRIKLLPVFLVLLTGILLFYGGKMILNTRIKNIFIYGNNYVKDDEILKLAEIIDYPKFYMTLSNKIENKILENPYIKTVSVKKSFYHVVEITIKENIPLFIKDTKDVVVLENETEVENTNKYALPRLINEVPTEIYSKFVENMKDLEPIVRSKISEIKYKPSEYDDSRFLLYMNDGNYVYLTLSKFEQLGHYNEVYETLENKKGTLYLDSGNHFVIAKEK